MMKINSLGIKVTRNSLKGKTRDTIDFVKYIPMPV